MVVGSIRAPVIGPIVARLENRQILKRVMRGGLRDPSQLPDHYLESFGGGDRRYISRIRPALEIHRSGRRLGRSPGRGPGP
jgi:hypothetical protein